MSESKYPNLFTPIRIGNFTAPNRIAMAPTDFSSGNADGSVAPRAIALHEEIAKGGTGFIIVGATSPDRTMGRPTVTCLCADEDPQIPGLANLAEAMHRHGATCAVQLQLPGRQAAWPRKNLASATDQVVTLPGSAGHEVVYAESAAHGKSIRAMTVEEVYEAIDKFAEAAWRIQQAGFDAVELHGAHGYLIAQFMSPYVNQRIDRFGGSFINRMRFVLEIVDRIKMKCGSDFPIGIRYSGEEYIERGRTLEESIKAAKLFEQAGVSFLDISAGIFELPGPTMDPMYYQQGWNTYTAEAIKKEVKVPVITSHTLREPSYCEKILAEGKADIVGLSRQLIADPYWADKARGGKPEEIRKCISCLVGCWQESLMVKKEMRCAINPSVGDERFIHLTPSAKASKIAVVGGGPAGMEAARIATLRGNKVTIFEKTHELGGAILNCCMIPGKNKMKWYSDWQREQVRALGIEVVYGSTPKAADLKKFDAVVVATGSKVDRPAIPGIDLPIVHTYEEILRCKIKTCEYYPKDRVDPVETGSTVLIWGDHFSAADCAERLGTADKKIYIVTKNGKFAQWMEPCHKDVMDKRFACGNGEGMKGGRTFSQPVTIIPKSTVVEIAKDGSVTLLDDTFTKTTLKVDDVVLALVVPDDSLYEELLREGVLVTRVGDRKRVRNLRAAVTEGANAGLIIEADMVMNANNGIVSALPTEVRLGSRQEVKG